MHVRIIIRAENRGCAPILQCARFRMRTRTHIIAEVYTRVRTRNRKF